MNGNAAAVAFGLGCGIGAATGMDVARWGLDGLNLLGIMVSSLLVYLGGRELFSNDG